MKKGYTPETDDLNDKQPESLMETGDISQDEYLGMSTELKARLISFHKEEHSKGFNDGLMWAIRLIDGYKNGKGLWQIKK